MTLGDVQPSPSLRGEAYTLNRWGSFLEGKDSNQGPHSVSMREPENPGAEMARVAKCALVY